MRRTAFEKTVCDLQNKIIKLELDNKRLKQQISQVDDIRNEYQDIIKQVKETKKKYEKLVIEEENLLKANKEIAATLKNR